MSSSSEVVAVILAAGPAERFGSAKQAVEVEGIPMVQRAVDASRVPEVRHVVVVVGAHAAAVRSVLQGEDVELLQVPPNGGLGDSLAAGIAAVPNESDVLVLLADQPGVNRDAVARVVAERSDRCDAVRATYSDRPGHPVLLRPSARPALTGLSGDQGAARFLDTLRVTFVPCDDIADDRDVDVPGDLDLWRSKPRPE